MEERSEAWDFAISFEVDCCLSERLKSTKTGVTSQEGIDSLIDSDDTIRLYAFDELPIHIDKIDLWTQCRIDKTVRKARDKACC